MPSSYRIVPLLEVLDLLPESNWHKQRVLSNDREVGHWKVLLVSGPLELAELPLHELPQVVTGAPCPLSADEPLVLLLVDGNLRVRGPIHSLDWDAGGPGLVVRGNLHVHAMLVGGEDICVTGDLQVDTLFWGHYNHGSLNVDGHSCAQAWLSTEEYRIRIGEDAEGLRWLDHRETLPAPTWASLTRLFRADAVEPLHGRMLCEVDDAVNAWLKSSVLIEASRRGEPLLQQLQEPPMLPPQRMSGQGLDLAGFRQLLDTSLLAYADAEGKIELEDGPVYCILQPRVGVMSIRNAERSYVLSISPARESWLPWRRKVETLSIEGADRTTGKWRWRWRSVMPDEPTLQTLWAHCLALVGHAERLRPQIEERISIERMQALLELPYTRETFPAYDDGEYFGSVYLAVRQAEEGDPRLGIAWRGSEARLENGWRDHCFFNYGLSEENGEIKRNLWFQPQQEEDTSQELALNQPRYYQGLLNWFEDLAELLERGQRMLDQEAEGERRRWSLAAQAVADKQARYVEVPLADAQDGSSETFRFRVLPYAAVAQELDALQFLGKSAVPEPDDADGVFLVAEGDCTLSCLDMNSSYDDLEVAGYLFRGNLNVEKYLAAYDIDYSPLLVVTGDLRVPNVQLYGGHCFVGGNLVTECLYGFYNHGSLDVAGTLDADVLIARDYQVRSGKLHAGVIIAVPHVLSVNEYEDENGLQQTSLDCFPSNARVEDVFEAQLCDPSPFWGGYFPDFARLSARMRSDDTPVYDRERRECLISQMPSEEEVRRIFDWVFASPRLAEAELRVYPEGNADGDGLHAYALLGEDGVRHIGMHLGHRSGHMAGIEQAADGSLIAAHYVPRDARHTSYVTYAEPLGDTRLSPRLAVHLFYEALQRLGMLDYRQTLPEHTPPESAADVGPRLQQLHEQYVGDVARFADEEVAGRRLLLTLQPVEQKLLALCGMETQEGCYFAELATHAHAAYRMRQDAAFSYACWRVAQQLDNPRAWLDRAAFLARVASLNPSEELADRHAAGLEAAIAELVQREPDERPQV